ncbi:hypothetical protein A7U60_g3586 [Sanghuangporus baumii]|uniref:Uncharacterized protein n=1 Tax=Sanghuangporus baumii TaxID=108892 RepID=A0A9Q5N6K4_SANBA|nr:hypothetical protein A7U60_g3586 [Sanghuangporus baumii]
MSSAAAREARKKAILGRGGDRLSKLTTAARGEDHPVYSNTADISSRNAPTTETFVGEESMMPTPPVRASSSPEPPRAVKPGSSTQPSPWTNEHQQELLRALTSAPDTNRATAGTLNPFDTNNAPSESGAGGDPMSAMLSALSQMSGGPGQSAPEVTEAVPRSFFSKLRPLLHLLASWTLLAFFAFVMEPQAHEAASGSFATTFWRSTCSVLLGLCYLAARVAFNTDLHKIRPNSSSNIARDGASVSATGMADINYKSTRLRQDAGNAA